MKFKIESPVEEQLCTLSQSQVNFLIMFQKKKKKIETLKFINVQCARYGSKKQPCVTQKQEKTNKKRACKHSLHRSIHPF